jgi:hypothetical protein
MINVIAIILFALVYGCSGIDITNECAASCEDCKKIEMTCKLNGDKIEVDP